jgi:CRP-like cAMP-binding protein
MPSAPIQVAARERALAKLLPHNGLLAALPEEARARLLPHLGLVDLRPGHRLLEQDDAGVRAFFPLAGLVSLIQQSPDGSNVQVALVGRDGLVGLPSFMGGSAMGTRAVVQCPGYGLALGRERLMEEWGRGGSLMRVLLRYTWALQAQVSQLAKCRRDHSIEQQLCRLLLMSAERLPGQELGLTQDFAARLLGAEPEGVAQALSRLREAGLVTVRREGGFAIPDSAALQARACGCHRLIRHEYRRWLPAHGPGDPPIASSGQSRISASISSGLTGTPREISSQPASPTIASSSMRMPML